MNATETIQDIYAAFGRGDIDYILARVTPDSRWTLPGDLPYSGVYIGPEGAADFFRKMLAVEEFERFEPREFLESVDRMVALGFEQCRSKATGKTASSNWAMAFRVRGDQVAALECFSDAAAA